MKYFIFLFLSICTTFCDIYSQNEETGGCKEIYTWTFNCNTNDSVNFRLESLGCVWNWRGDTLFYQKISSFMGYSVVQNDYIVHGTSNINWSLGYDNLILSGTSGPPFFSYGLYKCTIKKNSDLSIVFYLDYRDGNWINQLSYGNDIYLKYDGIKNKVAVDWTNGTSEDTIENFHYYSIPKMKNKNTINTTYFQDFWESSLIFLNIDHIPRLIWGAYPNNNKPLRYNIEKKTNNNNYILLDTTDNNTFFYNDDNVWLGGSDTTTTIKYRIKAVYSDSVTLPTNEVIIHIDPELQKKCYSVIKNDYTLSNPYPNPFNPTTKISYTIKERGLVTLKVYDVLGKEIMTLVNEQKEAGSYEVNLNAGTLSSGVYLYALHSGSYYQSKKLVVVK